MSKKDEGAAPRCEKCGIVLMFGPAHNCKPKPPGSIRAELPAEEAPDDAGIDAFTGMPSKSQMRRLSSRKRSPELQDEIERTVVAAKQGRGPLNKVTTITETPAGTFIDEEADIPEAAIKSKTSIAVKAERRAGKKQLSVWIDAGLDRQMRIAVAEDVMRLEAWIEKVLREYLARRAV